MLLCFSFRQFLVSLSIVVPFGQPKTPISPVAQPEKVLATQSNATSVHQLSPSPSRPRPSESTAPSMHTEAAL